MNNIELEILTLCKSLIRDIQGFLKKKGKIDWEQRRYEIAKDLLVHYQGSDIKACIKIADMFIDELKNEEKKS